VKAKNAEVYSYTKETYQEAPNVYISDNFKTENKISKSILNKVNTTGELQNLFLGQRQKVINLKEFCTNQKILTRIKNIL
jgi:hypothetical protein